MRNAVKNTVKNSRFLVLILLLGGVAFAQYQRAQIRIYSGQSIVVGNTQVECVAGQDVHHPSQNGCYIENVGDQYGFSVFQNPLGTRMISHSAFQHAVYSLNKFFEQKLCPRRAAQCSMGQVKQGYAAMMDGHVSAIFRAPEHAQWAIQELRKIGACQN